MSTIDEFTALIESVLDLDMELSAESRVEELPGWDSVNAMRLIAHIEKEFGAKLPIKEYLNAQTVGKVYSLIAGAQQAHE